MSTDTDAISVDRLVSVYIKIRDKKAAVAAQLKKEEAALNEKLEIVKTALLEHCKENVDSAYTITVRRSKAND